MSKIAARKMFCLLQIFWRYIVISIFSLLITHLKMPLFFRKQQSQHDVSKIASFLFLEQYTFEGRFTLHNIFRLSFIQMCADFLSHVKVIEVESYTLHLRHQRFFFQTSSIPLCACASNIFKISRNTRFTAI